MSDRLKFARTATALLMVGATIVLTLNCLQKHDLIDNQTEGLLRLIVNSVLALVIIRSCFRTPLDMTLRVAILFTIAAAISETALDYTEDIPALTTTPIVGQESSSRRTLEAFLAAGWMLGLFSVMLFSIRLFQNTRLEDLERLNEVRKSQSTTMEANRALELALAELQATQDQLLQRERLSALGQMASGVAHDLNNALSPAAVFVELLLTENTGSLTPKQRNILEAVQQSLLDAAATIRGLQFFYASEEREPPQAAESVDLAPLLKQVVSMTRPKWKAESERFGHDTSVTLNLSPAPRVLIDPAELRMVITNLIFNAVEAMPQGGTITISLGTQDDDAVISVVDTGAGMSPTAIRRCFDPFYTTKQQGTGLGLNVCLGIIERAGGSIRVSSSQDVGTEFKIRLPASDVTTAAAARDPNPTENLRLLLIEDDVIVGRAVAALLRQLGAEVVTESSGTSALQRFQEDGPFDLVVTDMGMPGMDGRAVIDATRQRNSQQAVAVLSGWSETEVMKRFAGTTPPNAILSKPPTTRSLKQLLHSVKR